MTRPYKLSTEPLSPHHPLHWTRFWPNLQRVHASRASARQDLVLWLATAWAGAMKSSIGPRGFRPIKLRLSTLRDMVRDYQPALDYFFTVQRLGFNIGEENFEISTVIPNKLAPEVQRLITREVEKLRFEPTARPEYGTSISKVYLLPGLDAKSLVQETIEAGRPEIVPQLQWLLKQPAELNFHFARSGKLQQRDTSVWPIAAIETWPGWLREKLFGPGIDLDAAYVQFLMKHLKAAFVGQRARMEMLFGDLIRLLEEKEQFRKDLCENVLGLEFNHENRTAVKRIIMSLANGSRISGKLLVSGTGFSSATDLIRGLMPEASTARFMKIGEELKKLNDQFVAARRYAAIELTGSPTRENVKDVFSHYFTWEREARYALWEAVDRHGIMVHDGLDGVPAQYLSRVDDLIEQLDLKLSA